MSDVKNYFSKLSLKYQGSEEERSCAELIFSEIDISLGDKRLNSLSARTYNATACEKIFALLEKALSPQEHPWKTLYKSLLLLHTIILYGSELAIDKCIGLCRIVNPLQEYNSALVKKGFFYGGGGMDYGAPVRMEAKIINAILINDNNIRKARSEARSGQDSLVPMGTDTLLSLEDHNPSSGMGAVSFGQGLETSVGAGFGLHAVPGMYDNRPERYFDNSNDPRKRPTDQQVDSQYTRDIQAPSLLDLVFDDHGHSNTATNLPEAQYLPALEKQKELERQLAEQTAQLKKLQELQAQQGQLQALQLQQPQHSQQYNQQNQQYSNQNQANGNFNNYPVPAAPLVSDSLLDLNHHDTATALLQHNNPHYPQPGHMQNNVSAPHVSHMHHSYSPTVATFGSLHDLNVHASASAIMNHNNPQQGQGVNNIGYSTPAGYTHAHHQQSHQHMSHMEQHYPVHASLSTGPTNSASAAFMSAPTVPHHSAPSTPHSNNAYQTQQYPNTAMSTGFAPPGPPQQQQQQQQQQYGTMSGVPPPPIPSQFQNSQYTSSNYPQQQPLQPQYGMNQPQQSSYGSPQYGAQQPVFQQQPYQQQAQQQSFGQPSQAPPPVPPRAPF